MNDDIDELVDEAMENMRLAWLGKLELTAYLCEELAGTVLPHDVECGREMGSVATRLRRILDGTTECPLTCLNRLAPQCVIHRAAES